MKVLFIGGTGLISIACSELALQRGMDLTVLNRSASRKHASPPGSKVIIGDIHSDSGQIAEKLAGQHFDVVVDWIAFNRQDVERDINLFSGKTDQFIFISSASAYQKPPANYLITEETPLENPFWQYSRDKIDSEQRLMEEYRKNGFPVTIIRPSLTYGPLSNSDDHGQLDSPLYHCRPDQAWSGNYYSWRWHFVVGYDVEWRLCKRYAGIVWSQGCHRRSLSYYI